jgi:hypothetical protein
VSRMPKLRKPSPAMIVAIAALCVSLVGTAVAAPVAVISLNKKEKKQVRKIAGKVSNKRITKRAPNLSVKNAKNAQAAASATSALGAENANRVGGKGLNDIAMWAFVDDTGILFRSSGGVASIRVGTGSYVVTFPRPVNTCAYNATNAANDGTVPAVSSVSVALAAGPGNGVRVETPSDDEFFLIVTC